MYEACNMHDRCDVYGGCDGFVECGGNCGCDAHDAVMHMTGAVSVLGLCAMHVHACCTRCHTRCRLQRNPPETGDVVCVWGYNPIRPVRPPARPPVRPLQRHGILPGAVWSALRTAPPPYKIRPKVVPEIQSRTKKTCMVAPLLDSRLAVLACCCVLLVCC